MQAFCGKIRLPLNKVAMVRNELTPRLDLLKNELQGLYSNQAEVSQFSCYCTRGVVSGNCNFLGDPGGIK
jgi:hypothetical protein